MVKYLESVILDPNCRFSCKRYIGWERRLWNISSVETWSIQEQQETPEVQTQGNKRNSCLLLNKCQWSIRRKQWFSQRELAPCLVLTWILLVSIYVASAVTIVHFNYWWSTSLRRIFSLYATILHALKYEQWCSKVKRKQLISWKTLNMTFVFWSVCTFKKHMTCVNSHHIWVLPHIYMDCFLVTMLKTILWYLWQLAFFFLQKAIMYNIKSW